MSPPSYTPPPPDPLALQQEQQAKQDQVTSLQDLLTGDTASLMSRYGSLAAIGATTTGK